MAGRPTDYRPEFVEQAAKLASLGAIDIEIADFFGVSESSLNRWKHEHPEFWESIKTAKENADRRVVQSLYKRALGFEHDSVKIFCNKDGEVTEAPFREYIPPDPTSMIFWLKNRQKDDWRDKQDIDLNVNEGLAARLKSALERVDGK